MKPIDLFRNTSHYQKMKKYVEKLTSPNCYVTVAVQAMNVEEDIDKRIYRIIGKYANIFT